MKHLLTLAAAVLLTTALSAKTTTKSAYDLSYDVANGWYWYEEKVVD